MAYLLPLRGFSCTRRPGNRTLNPNFGPERIHKLGNKLRLRDRDVITIPSTPPLTGKPSCKV